MNAAEIRAKFISDLQMHYSKREAESLFFVFLEEYTRHRRIDFLSDKNLKIGIEEKHLIQEALERLKEGEPYQHILGEVGFAGLRLKVSRAALVPRPETEELVYLIKEELKPKMNYRILDIGTGTGCIALSCKKFFPKANITAVDISAEALQLAKTNAVFNKLEVSFFNEDILNPSPAIKRDWDVIVSNPPYIAESEEEQMDRNVTGYDPHKALFVSDEDPLLFYKEIRNFSLAKLTGGGKIFLEINERFGKETAALFREEGYSAEVRKDMSGKDRFVVVKKLFHPSL